MMYIAGRGFFAPSGEPWRPGPAKRELVPSAFAPLPLIRPIPRPLLRHRARLSHLRHMPPKHLVDPRLPARPTGPEMLDHLRRQAKRLLHLGPRPMRRPAAAGQGAVRLAQDAVADPQTRPL